MTDTTADQDTTSHDATSAHRWLLLAVVALAQLMVVLDATIVNIALPDAQKALHFGFNDYQWVVTAYALPFGSLLLLGGRIGDLFGRKRVFITGLGGFAIASAVGGAAVSFPMLVTARAFQGGFGALLAPAALAILTTTFREDAERNKAFGVFGAVAGSGAALGLVLGGLLTEFLNWRFTLFVNLLFASVAILGAARLVQDAERPDSTLDIPGTLFASGGLFGIVFGFARAEQEGWTSTTTLVSLAAGVVLLVAFVLVQRRVQHPLLPLRVVLDRTRGGCYLAVGISGIAIFGVFLFLTLYLQEVAGYSPLLNGVAFLPLTAFIVVSSTTSNVVLLPRLGPRALVMTGMAMGAVGMLLLVRLPAHSSYGPDILPTLVILGLGFGLIFAPAINTATDGSPPQDAGVASAMVNTMQQVSGSVGTALLSTIVGTVTTRYVSAHIAATTSPARRAAVTVAGQVHGYHTIFVISALIFLGGAVLCGALIRRRDDQQAIAAATSTPASAVAG
jgi:EmrB/QacA subfamily drug resistance transporter